MRFNCMFGLGVKKTSVDCSNQFEDVYTEIAPYAVDIKTGQVLNKNSYPIIKKTGRVNIDEKIQSYKNDCDIYKILERFAISGDSSIINQRVGSFGDFTHIPDNVNDFNKAMDLYLKQLNEHDKDVAKMILSDKVTTDEIVKLIDSRLAEKLKKESVNNE